MTHASPVARTDRLETLDVLRGFALLGILAMNIRIMAAPLGAYMYPIGLFEYEGASRTAYLLSATLFDLKMMGLFSMLFGVSVLLYSRKSADDGASVRGLWFRRMFWLLVIGLVHAYLIWNGDILVPYALCGLLLLWWVRRLGAATLLALAAAMLAVGAALTVGHGLSWNTMSEPDRAQELAMYAPSTSELQVQLAAMLGTYTETVRHRAPFVLLFQTLVFATFFFWRCSGMMLIGMALYKSGFLDGQRPVSTYALVAGTCLPLGLGLSGYGALAIDRAAYAMPDRLLLDLWNYAGAIFASVGYAAAIILLVKIDVVRGVRRALAAVGQMAFSNYLLHSILSSVLFLGWGFGLAGRLDYAEQFVFVAAIWAAQLALSPIWLARYRFGPAEWLWRSLTYWERQPMQRESPLGQARAAGTP
jgi:uncharacterized protein